MAQLYLPAEHTEADLVLAGQVAESIASAELYVAWTADQGTCTPEVAAELRAPEPSWLALFVAALAELWAALRYKPAPNPHAPRPAAEPRETAA